MSLPKFEALTTDQLLEYVLELAETCRKYQKAINSKNPKSKKYKIYLASVLGAQEALDDSITKIKELRATPLGLSKSAIENLEAIVAKAKPTPKAPSKSVLGKSVAKIINEQEHSGDAGKYLLNDQGETVRVTLAPGCSNTPSDYVPSCKDIPGSFMDSVRLQREKDGL
jgi:hypothetical protein